MVYPELKITFLGTGTSSGIPMIGCSCAVCTSDNSKDKRLRSSILVQSKETTLVVDTTPDFRYQMLRENVKDLHAVLITHHHKDHIAGLDDIRAFNYFSGKTMQVYATEPSQEALKREFSYIFSEKKYPGIPKIHLNTIESEPFTVGDILIQPIHLMHLNMPVLGFRFGKFTYITDANFISAIELEKIRSSECLVLNALRNEPHISHFSIPEAVALAEALEIKQTWLTHMSHQAGKHDDVNMYLPKNVQLSFDGLNFKI